ncbi:hypothetical protein [Actinokineospora sp.]|uniref:hypothetical protein n=1 Tax=Actinokineospora sp. TaxID=1872133 RepID=UPI004038451F
MDERLHRALAEAVSHYLDAVDRLAGRQQAVVAIELRRLAASWRALLGLHRQAGARCAGCGRQHLARAGPRRPAFCTVWRVAGAYFVRRLPGEGEVMSSGFRT